MINNQYGREAFETMVITIGIVTAFLGIIVWFICWIQSGTDQIKLKHETCMVETTTSQINNTVTITEYCGPNNKGVIK